MRKVIFPLLILVLSCQEDPNLVTVCTDPIGSKNITTKNNGIFCFKDVMSGCFVTPLTASDRSLWAIDYTGTYPNSMVAMIADAGQIKCLGEVKVKPTTGYVYKIEAKLKHGYVVLLPDNTYGRLFIDSWTVNASGVVTELNITYQYSF
ncbi:MAG: hypothetical protein JST14_14245 [Bacteroidetes bacterium]|nr:hypothetical protein [Bacteroidota bacterium]